MDTVSYLPNPEDSGRSPLELFSRKTWPTSKFQDFHVWGSPAYVLDSSLAGGRQVPRWQARSSRCVFVGQSSKQGVEYCPTVEMNADPLTKPVQGSLFRKFRQRMLNLSTDQPYSRLRMDERAMYRVHGIIDHDNHYNHDHNENNDNNNKKSTRVVD